MKSINFIVGLITTALTISLLSTQTSAREYYKWIDSNGSTHYTKTPPPKNAKKKGKVETFGLSSSTQVSSNHNQTEQQNLSNTPNTQSQTQPQTSTEPTPTTSESVAQPR